MSGLKEWFFQPLVEVIDYAKECHYHNMEDLVRQNKVTFEMRKPSERNNIAFRPTKFSDYIGQEKAKNMLQSYIAATKKRETVLPHILIHGPAGCG